MIFFSLSLSDDIRENKFDFTTLTDNLSEDEVIILDSHDDIFKEYQIHYWRKDSISDILPAINCPYFKSKTKIFKTSEMSKMKQFIKYQGHTKSKVIENTDEEISINLVYGNTIKIVPNVLKGSPQTKYFDKLKERYKIWKIDDCACKPKKIRIWEDSSSDLKYDIEEHKKILNINDIKIGMYDWSIERVKMYSNFNVMHFNHLSSRNNNTKLVFSGDSLTVVYNGNTFNFRLDQRTKESIINGISGWI